MALCPRGWSSVDIITRLALSDARLGAETSSMTAPNSQ
jgi:hypothetical protein